MSEAAPVSLEQFVALCLDRLDQGLPLPDHEVLPDELRSEGAAQARLLRLLWGLESTPSAATEQVLSPTDRVVAALRGVTLPIAVVASPDPVGSKAGATTPHAWVQYLTARIAVLVVPALDAEAWVGSAVVERARTLFLEHPDVTAVAVAADDEELTAIVVDPYEVAAGIEASSGDAVTTAFAQEPLPLAHAVERFLQWWSPLWDPVEVMLEGDPATSVTDIMREAADAAIAQMRAKADRVRIPEKRAALESLTQEDAHRLAELLTDLQRNTPPSDSLAASLSEYLETV